MSSQPKKKLTREEAKTVDFLAGLVLMIVAGAIIVHAFSEAEPFIATAMGLFRASGQ